MKPEQKMWADLRKAIGPLWHATRHEDLLSKGVPDVSYGALGYCGWIELKALDKFPAKGLKIDHFTKEQRSWLFSRGAKGGNTWLLIKIGKEWLLFDHLKAQNLDSIKTMATAVTEARAWWRGIDEIARDPQRFLQILNGGIKV